MKIGQKQHRADPMVLLATTVWILIFEVPLLHQVSFHLPCPSPNDSLLYLLLFLQLIVGVTHSV